MAVLPVIQLYQPNIFCPGSCLRMECEDVKEEDFSAEWFHQFVKDLFETLYAGSSGVGLSANQVGILKKVSVIDLGRDAKNPIILVNPTFIPLSDDKVDSLEVCLSFPDVAVTVPRYRKVRVLYQDLKGQHCEFVAEGFRSKVCQHEISHLYGKAHVDMAVNSSGIRPYGGTPARKAGMAYEKIL